MKRKYTYSQMERLQGLLKEAKRYESSGRLVRGEVARLAEEAKVSRRQVIEVNSGRAWRELR